MSRLFSQHNVKHRLCADDKQSYVVVPKNEVPAGAREVLQDRIADTGSWGACSFGKGVTLFSSRQNPGKVSPKTLMLNVGSTVTHSANFVLWPRRPTQLGVIDEKKHFLYRLVAWPFMRGQLENSVILYRFDYCKSLLFFLPRAGAVGSKRLLTDSPDWRAWDYLTTALTQPHWKQVEFRVTYSSLCYFAPIAHSGQTWQNLGEGQNGSSNMPQIKKSRHMNVSNLGRWAQGPWW